MQPTDLGIEKIEESSAVHPEGVQGAVQIEIASDSPLFELVNQLLLCGLLPSVGIDPSAYRIIVDVHYMADAPEPFA